MPIELLTRYLLRLSLFTFVFLVTIYDITGREISGSASVPEARPLTIGQPSGYVIPDLYASPDTLNSSQADSLLLNPSDTTRSDTLIGKGSKDEVDAQVTYTSKDSLKFDLRAKKVFLWGEAEINYKKINLKADYIEINFDENTVYATGLPDSSGKIAGVPVFTEDGQSFKSRVIKYNYKTKKGFINKVITEDGGGYLYGEIVKKMPDDEINISKGHYTTCDIEDHPHFEFKFNKSKVIPGKRIVTGPAYLVVEDVPTPLFIPFGYFPNKVGQRSGILLPTYGESANRGFYFENGGYYLYLNDYVDFQITGDIYTRGSWALKPKFNYKKRYKYSGNLDLSYAINTEGVKETPNYSRKRDFAVTWVFQQDPKARPHSRFNANVNVKSGSFNKYNPTSTQDYLSNTFSSSISYQTSFAGKYFLTINAGHDQNTITHAVNVTLPEINFSTNTFYPFRSAKMVGKLRWYDNIQVKYNMNAKNQVNSTDSTFFQPSTLDNMKNGIKHSVPISSSIKLLRYFTMTNSISLTDRMYFQTLRKQWSNDTLINGADTTVGYLAKDTIPGFANAFDYSLSSGISTTLYGMLQFGPKFPIQAIRHVFKPSVSFSYVPDFGTPAWGYYDSYNDVNGDKVEYSKFEGSLFGGPGNAKSGRIGFSFSNNLEMKVRSRKDTITGTKKINLIDQFTISFSYDIARDSLNWSPVSLSGRTKLFKSLDVTYRADLDPYVLDSSGTRNLNRFEWTQNHRLLRLKNTSWNISLNYRLSSKEKKKKFSSNEGSPGELEAVNENPSGYIDWSIPWDLTLRYIFNYTATHSYPEYVHKRTETLTQTLGLIGKYFHYFKMEDRGQHRLGF